ncbi:MAG TPA: 5-formyltetrahydrofolate cyclo-ligase [Caproicibacter sp.]|nr:5-formyltetrahydrofolate cyclo-ligase [Caproicibacter sp.]
MYIKNIRELKKDLRAQSRQFRERLDPEQKASLDAKIRRRMFALKEYGRSGIIYSYVSKPLEVDTSRLITEAMADGKKIAVPRCLPETLEMEFFKISSLSDLEAGCYGVLEPDPRKCRRIRDTENENAVCIVPGLSFDSQGYRLGYGKGYYDRFLADFKGITVGLCYSGCIRWNLPHGYYDRPVDILVTDKFIRRITGRQSDR